MLVNEKITQMLDSPVRHLRGRVEIYEGSTLTRICGCYDNLNSFTVERIGSNKFFGYGVCHKLSVNLIDTNREIDVSKKNYLEAVFGADNEYIYVFPNFYVEEVSRDENTNELSITAYDALYAANNHTVSELGLIAPYSIAEFAEACARLLGVPLNLPEGITAFDTVYAYGANFDGTETIRAALDDVAEATQTIYYIDNHWELTFKRLDISGDPVYEIDRETCFTFDKKLSHTITKVVHATEAGEGVHAPESPEEGTVQYIRDNPFWDMQEDIQPFVDNAWAAVSGLTITQFNCEHRGNFLVEIGDKISIVDKTGNGVISYLLNDSITFDGALSQTSSWTYDENEGETESDPTSLGDILNQTRARVDKANKRIDFLVSDTQTIEEGLKEIRTKQTKYEQTSESITLRVESIENNGVTQVNTGTGYTFDEEGLRISKDNSGIENLIDNTGMYVNQDGTQVLSANETGVKAKDLHAVTYLWIGSHSRFEDYEGGRTGCFWIS